MKKEYVCVESSIKNLIGVVFNFEENIMHPIESRRWETKTYTRPPYKTVYAEKKDVTYLVTHGDECVVLDLNGCPYYKGNFQYYWSSPEWIREKDYLVCEEYSLAFKAGDIVKLKSEQETRLEVVERIYCTTKYIDGGSYKTHYEYQLKGKDELYTVNEIQPAFDKYEFKFKRCVKSPRGGLVLNRIYRCRDTTGLYNYRRVYYETGFNKSISQEELQYHYKFVDATLEEYLEQYNTQFEPKQKRVRTYSSSKRKEDGKVCRDNFADFMNGKVCVHINSESDMNWFRLCLQQYGLEHKLTFTYNSVYPKPEYLLYCDNIVKYSFMSIESMKVLEVTDLL